MSEGSLPPATGSRVGPYEVLFELAHGGMGTVYVARARGEPVGASGFERIVAIKRLHQHLTAQPENVQRFLDEASVAARIHHANVAAVHQVGSDEAGYFLVQEYVEGDTLQGLVDLATLRRRRLPPPIVLRIALDALAGLEAVHDATDAAGRPLGILHRDVSPHNLLVGRDGVTRLADFGIAKHALRSVVTDGRYLQGRVLCMPPEYLERRPIDRRFDVYGMGITLWTALAGDAPWPDASDVQLVHLAVTEGVPPLSASGLAIAPPVEAIVARACQRDPAARFASAREMLEAIEDLGRHTGWIASHGEVAALVAELAGKELAARRAALVEARGATPVREATPAATVTARAAEVPPRRVGGVVVAAAVILAVAGVTALLFAWRRPAPAEARPAASAPVASAPATSAPAFVEVAPAPGGTSSAAAAPTSVPRATAGPRRSAAPPKATASAAAPVGPAATPVGPAAAPVGSAAAPVGPAAPSGISTANPYR